MSYRIVWFKRDLRLHDHTPLAEAAREGPVLCLYVVEPGLWAQPDAALQHYHFVQESLHDLAQALQWFEQASLQGHAQAQHRLGLMFFRGEGVPANNVQAYIVLKMAAVNGAEEALDGRLVFQHFHHVAIMRKILLRMGSWLNYLFPFH